ncbi:MAG: B12-binding domain-containing radical SAM protein [Nitrospinae bacterium]|nr:B12-binding domain-containing radical SAM protein [Nitrospinota bacterium]
MKILLINPRFPPSLWDFSHIRHINGTRFPFPPLGLAVLAALTPTGHEITIVDENATDIDFSVDADMVGIAAYEIQKERAFEIARIFRQRGTAVALGGPLVNDVTREECEQHADALFIGEAEQTWPLYIADLQNNSPQAVYRQSGFPPLNITPIPRFDLLNLPSYATAIIETSRGCPFSCDFCEVPVRMGNIPRHKNPLQVMEEIKALAALGADSIFILDDNFTGNRKHAIAVLSALEHYQAETGHRLTFSCQLTMANAFDDELLALLHRCGFSWVFIGLETSDQKALASVNKRQNLAHDVREAVRNIQAHNLVIWGGMIVGFDGDDEAAIERQRQFIMEAGIPVVMVGLLQALPGTALHERMQNENRLEDASLGGVRSGQQAMLQTNIRPTPLSPEALATHYLRLMERLYRFPDYARRLLVSIQRARHGRAGSGNGPDISSLPSLLRVLRFYCFTLDMRRIYYFLRVLLACLRHRGLAAETVFMHLAVYIHLRKFHEELSLHHRP